MLQLGLKCFKELFSSKTLVTNWNPLPLQVQVAKERCKQMVKEQLMDFFGMGSLESSCTRNNIQLEK
ncbi:hypothetical protein DPMN_147417 [Dreissena polymorpha]|uniref:Uncharacterized protein n=1 Tax=Dreissena polymorpha TaxID=45954 RepID=A0A9D4J2Z4_DREPO|nr:hypothetical protein DPMN_147417 [Dreissena polymorpha]